MKLVYEGKTKNVYDLENGNYLMRLKDDATGKDGVFDPGMNTVGLSIEGLGRESLKMTKFFFGILTKKGIPNHFISCDIDKAEMTVKPAKHFGKGIEVVCRERAVGSFHRRYGEYIEFGAKLPSVVEFTLKDDTREDPPITKDILAALDIMTAEQYEEIKSLAVKVNAIVKDTLAEKGLELYDIKYEFGLVGGKVTLIDEFSGGVMRVYKGNEWIQPMDLGKYLY